LEILWFGWSCVWQPEAQEVATRPQSHLHHKSPPAKMSSQSSSVLDNDHINTAIIPVQNVMPIISMGAITVIIGAKKGIRSQWKPNVQWAMKPSHIQYVRKKLWKMSQNQKVMALTPSIVAMLGWIMPDPLAIPPSLTVTPPIFTQSTSISDKNHLPSN